MKRLLLAAAVLTAQAGFAADPADMPTKSGITPGFDVNAMDKSVDACTDFYQFACGGWVAKNPVPADRARFGRFDELQERNQTALRGILDKVSTPDPKRSAIDQKIGDYYATCMDEARIEAKGTAPLKPELTKIAAVKTKADLAPLLAHFHAHGVGMLFRFSSQQDFKDATAQIAVVDQGGLGLPDRDYYLKDDPRSTDLRAKYVAHVQKMFELLGDDPEAAARNAKAVMDVETALAQVSLERVKRRDPNNIYHKMKRSELVSLAPEFGWDQYLAARSLPPIEQLNVAVPDFFRGLDAALKSTDIESLKTYVRWHAVRAAAPLLPAAFVNENFAFYGKVLQGTKEIRPRWKRCVDFTDNDLGEALGQRYVEATFGAEGKERTAKMVAALELALEKDISELPWMTETTKKQALGKLHAIANKIGYPEKWRDYSSVKIVRGDAVGNSLRSNAFEARRRLDKIGKPVDRKEWGMSPPTVNAYYNPLMNDINFPAGILQPPFYDNAMDDAVNFGGIGAVIGHELTHGFDDQGRKFAANGNLSDWWTEEDGKEFEKRASCVADEYSSFTAAGEAKLNGRLTLGENTADNGGLRIAYIALLDTIAGKTLPPKDGFTPEQRLFLGWGQIWCQNETEESARLRAQTDPHSPGRYRVNGVVGNMPEFQKAFGCKEGSPMVRENACRVW